MQACKRNRNTLCHKPTLNGTKELDTRSFESIHLQPLQFSPCATSIMVELGVHFDLEFRVHTFSESKVSRPSGACASACMFSFDCNSK